MRTCILKVLQAQHQAYSSHFIALPLRPVTETSLPGFCTLDSSVRNLGFRGIPPGCDLPPGGDHSDVSLAPMSAMVAAPSGLNYPRFVRWKLMSETGGLADGM